MFEVTSPALKLWLPEVLTLSQNRTKGRGWQLSYKARQEEARAVLKALETGVGVNLPATVVNEAKRVLLAISSGMDVRSIRKPELRSHKSAATQHGPTKAYLDYKRVTTKPLDVENFVGSTKGLTDCLRYAFPSLLPDDRPEDVEIAHRQERCAHLDEQGTWLCLVREVLPAEP